MSATKDNIMESLFRTTKKSDSIPSIDNITGETSTDFDESDPYSTTETTSSVYSVPKKSLDLVDNQIIIITLDQVKAYDNNTRTNPNPQYYEIKESIRVRGLDNTPVITKRPGDDLFMIKNGGNTRLQALNELYNETLEKIKDAEKNNDQALVVQLNIELDKYFRHKWTYREFISEIDCLAGHVIENEQRGETLFIDKALSLQKFRDYFSENDDSIDINNSRILSTEIAKHGWNVSHVSISIMIFAIDHLYGYIPTLLHKGLSNKRVISIRTLKNKYITFVNKLNNTELRPSDFELIWENTLTNYDLTQDEDENINDSASSGSDKDKLLNNLINDKFNKIQFQIGKAIKLKTGISQFETTSHVNNSDSDKVVDNQKKENTHNDAPVNTEPDSLYMAVDTKSDESNINDSIDDSSESDEVFQVFNNKGDDTEANNSPDNIELEKNTNSIWCIVYDEVVLLSESYGFEDCVIKEDNYPGYRIIIENKPNQLISQSILLWLKSLYTVDSNSLLPDTNISAQEALDLSIYLSNERLNNNKLLRQLTRIEKNILTANKMLIK